MRDAISREVWYGDGFTALMARAVLTPLEWVFGLSSLLVGESRARTAGRTLVPTISVGNLTVGGTGKTPMAAWFAAELVARGRKPVLLLRGYGDDETLVHARLNPGVPVIANPDRRAAAAAAVSQGATALVLDDAFQHRQMPRDADVVLVSADLWSEPARLLPAGPFREPLIALRRAQLIIVTRKAATSERAGRIAEQLRRIAGAVPVAIAHLAGDQLVAWRDGTAVPLPALHGQSVLAVAGIGAPDAFLAQLRATEASVDALLFADHHAFSDRDVQSMVARAARVDRVVCTLKDAVKLGPIWPAECPPLWYLSQSVQFEAGASHAVALLDRLVATTAPSTPPSGG